MDAASFGFTVDLINEVIHFNHGYSVPIITMLDDDGEFTDDPKEVVYIEAIAPPDGRILSIDLRDLDEECFVTTVQ